MSIAVPREPVAFVAHFLKPYRLWLACIGLVVLVGSACESLQPYVIKLLVDTLGVTQDVHSAVFIWRAFAIGAGFIGLRFVIVTMWWFFQLLRGKIEPVTERAIRQTLLEQLLQHPYGWFLNGFAGRTGQRIDTAARSFRERWQEIKS